MRHNLPGMFFFIRVVYWALELLCAIGCLRMSVLKHIFSEVHKDKNIPIAFASIDSSHACM
jgi:hypothetical protein